MIHLFDVEFTLLIKTVGLVLLPGVGEGSPELKVGDWVRLKFPNGSELETQIKSFESIRRSPDLPVAIQIAVSSQLKVPVGTKVFSVVA